MTPAEAFTIKVARMVITAISNMTSERTAVGEITIAPRARLPAQARITPNLVSSTLLALSIIIILAAMWQPATANGDGQTTFKRIPTQFIAALGDPDASSGSGAEAWGLWRVYPGPRGVRLNNFEQLKAAGGVAPAQWEFDHTDWWLEENGLIMEKPTFPLPAGKYIVTGDREAMSVLTIHPADDAGVKRWELGNATKLYDVTHLPCRSARYTPAGAANSCSPANAPKHAFRVTPGAPMPPVQGCNKQDYAVLFIIAVATDN